MVLIVLKLLVLENELNLFNELFHSVSCLGHEKISAVSGLLPLDAAADTVRTRVSYRYEIRRDILI
jgi:hypothetical protein